MAGTFQKWVADSGGPKAAARKLKVSIHSVKHWHARKGSPRIGTIIRMVTLADGALTYASIIESTQPRRHKGGGRGK